MDKKLRFLFSQNLAYDSHKLAKLSLVDLESRN